MTLLFAGAITWYAYTGGPLRCGGDFDTSHTWIAVDLDAYPAWKCGDLARVTVGDEVMTLRVKDSGPLSAYFIDTPAGLVPIVADLPWHAWGWGDALSVLGMVENVTGGLRDEMGREQ